MTVDRKALLEICPIEQHFVGKDPRKMTSEELTGAGLERESRSSAIRRKCLDCCGMSPSEVRRCVSVTCTLWPFRQGTDPWREKREVSEEQREAARVRFAALREAASVEPSEDEEDD